MSSSVGYRVSHGSVKSMKSLGGVSIFQDPEAGTTLPRDAEITLTMYEPPTPTEDVRASISGDDGNNNKSSKTTYSKTTSSKRESSSVASGKENGFKNGDSDGSNSSKKDNTAYMFTYSQTMTSNSSSGGGGGSGTNKASTLPTKQKSKANKSKQPVKTGSFQMKPSFGYAQPAQPQQTPSSSQSNNESFKISSKDKGKTSNKQFSSTSVGQQNGYHHNSVETRTIEKKSNIESNGQGEGIIGGDNRPPILGSVGVDDKHNKLERHDSDLTSVSSLTSSVLVENYQKKPSYVKQTSDTSADYVTASQTSLSRSESQKSLSKAPSLSSITEYNKMVITDVYNDGDEDNIRGEGDYNLQSSFSQDTGRLETKSSKMVASTTKTSKTVISHGKTSEIEEMKTQSIVQNRDFKDKMASLMNTHNKKTQGSLSSSTSSIARGNSDASSYRTDLHLDIKNDRNPPNESHVESATFPRTSHDNRPISPMPMSPVEEMQQTIKFGTVGSLVKDKFKNLNLTGRSIDAASLERQKSKTSTGELGESPSTGGTPGEQSKKFKFLIEGIDFPEREVPVEQRLDFENVDGEEAISPPDVESPANTKKRLLTKKGFSYVLDEKLASAIIKKAEDVATRRPHEALDVKTSSEIPKEEKSEVLVEAKANLKHDDSFSMKRTDYTDRTPNQAALLQDIRSRLVVRKESQRVQEEEEEQQQENTVSITTSVTESHNVKMRNKSPQRSSSPVPMDFSPGEMTQEFETSMKRESRGESMLLDSSSTNIQQQEQQDESSMSSVSTLRSDASTTNTLQSTSTVTTVGGENNTENIQIKTQIVDQDNKQEEPKSHSMFFMAETKSPKRSKASKPVKSTTTKFEEEITQIEIPDNDETDVNNSTLSSSQGMVSLERNIKNINEQFKQHQNMTDSETVTKSEEHNIMHSNANTEVKSLRDMNKFNNVNNQVYANQTTRPITEHEVRIEDDSSSLSSQDSIVEQEVIVSKSDRKKIVHIEAVRNRRSSTSSDSTISQQYDLHDSLSEDGNMVLEQDIIPFKKHHKSNNKQNSQKTNIHIETRNTNREDYRDTEYMMDNVTKSNGTNPKVLLNAPPQRHVSHKDIVDERTKEPSKIYVTRDRHIKSSNSVGGGGRHTNELYIEVGDSGNKHTTHTQGGITNAFTNISNRDTHETFYQGGQVVQQSSDITVQRLKNKRGQLYTSVNSSKNNQPVFYNGYNEQKSPRGGSVLLVRQSPHTSGLPSPQYPGSESTHNSTSSGAVSSPEYRDDIFYQPHSPHKTARHRSNISRSSSSVTGSIPSQSRSDVYVYRQNPRTGRTLSDISQRDGGIIHLKPLKADRRQKELKTHPTFYTPNNSNINTMTTLTKPVIVTDYGNFEHSSMNATSTLRPNTDTGFIHIMDNASLQSGRNNKQFTDENMNYTSQTSPTSPTNRYLTVDEISRGRIPIRRGMKVSTINIETNNPGGYDSNDALSAFSEPTFTRNSKYHVQKVMDNRKIHNEFATPIEQHPDVAFKKQKIYQVTRNTSNSKPPPPPSVEVQLDPHLQEAHKAGNNYNVTMKLNASHIGVPRGGDNTTEDLFREEYVEESLYKNSNSMRGMPPQFSSPRGASSSVSDDLPILSPASRSKTNITLINDYQSQPPPINTNTNTTNVEHLQFKQYVDGPPQLNVSSHRNMHPPPQTNEPYHRRSNNNPPQRSPPYEPYMRPSNNNPPQRSPPYEPYMRPSNNNQPQRSPPNEPYMRPSNNNPPQRSPPTNNNTNAPPKFSMCIDQTMTMDYVPSDQENDNSPPIQQQRYNNVNSSSMEYSPNRMVQQQNGDIYNSKPYDEDDLENYLSPAEEEDDSPTRAKNDERGYGYPQVVRGSILIKNAIDTTGAPKVIDVVEEVDSDDDTLINDNVNPFDGHYFQARENPMYHSDPDLRIKKEKAPKPEFASRLFDDPSSRRNNRFNSLENEDYDTEIQVTRGSNENKSPRTKSQKSENTSYVYNGYDYTDLGSASKSKQSSTSVSKSRESSTQLDIQRLLANAPPNSIRQTINVEREEEEILGPLPNGDDGTGPESLLNFDTISEKVDLGMKDGAAQVSVKVRCERIVPIRGVEDMFKKSSVIVTRLIEINLMVTEERKRLYEHITNKNRNMVTSSSGGGKSRSSKTEQKLSTKDTFKLYKTFMGMAEADEDSKKENVRIDRKIEEQHRPEVQARANLMDMDMDNGIIEDDGFEQDTDALDRQLEEQLIAHAMRDPEPDTISYMSVASESGDILY